MEFFSLSHFVSQFPPTRFPLLSAIGMCYFLPGHHLEMAFLSGFEGQDITKIGRACLKKLKILNMKVTMMSFIVDPLENYPENLRKKRGKEQIQQKIGTIYATKSKKLDKTLRRVLVIIEKLLPRGIWWRPWTKLGWKIAKNRNEWMNK